MAQQTIRFRIRPDGRVEELVEGVLGAGCQQLTEGIEARIGVVQQRQVTSEAFAAPLPLTQATALGQETALGQATVLSQVLNPGSATHTPAS